MNKLLGSRIKALRSANNLTQEEVADQIGISRQKYARIESGANSITLDILSKVAEVLGVTVGDITKVLDEKKEPNNYISKENAQISDKDALVEIIDTILENNPKQIEDYKNGRTNLFDYFVGQVMKETRGKANPVITKEILKEKL